MSQSPAGGRAMRADARANHDRLLDVAARHFAAYGSEASLKAIAKEAGVGIGTLYRRFPTREILVEATYRSESQRLCDAGYDLLRDRPAAVALRAWMERFLDYMATKHGMADALRVVLTADEGLRLDTRGMLIDVLGMMLREGERQGGIRPGLDPLDVVMALGGFALIAGDQGDRAMTGRLLDLLMVGVLTPEGCREALAGSDVLTESQAEGAAR